MGPGVIVFEQFSVCAGSWRAVFSSTVNSRFEERVAEERLG